MITGKSIATLIIFFLSITFVIQPLTVPIRLPIPILNKRPRHLTINLTTAPIIAIAILWASQCLGPKEIRDGIVGVDGVKPYNILILFFSLAYMAITLDITGILQSAAFWVSNKGGSNGYKLFFYFYLMLTTLSVLLGNDPVILSGTAFLVYYTKVAELDPVSWLIAEFTAANTASMVLFVGNPTNVVICEGFTINNAAFTAYTILPFLGCIVAGLIALAFQFRNQKYIPRKLNAARDLDVRSVLLDPFGALVGSILLGSCLVTIIIVSFFKVDVWKISLPFAVAKFIFDLSWDHYRYVKDIPILGRKRSDPRSTGVDGTENREEEVVLQELRRASTMGSTSSAQEARRRQHTAQGTLPPVDEDPMADSEATICASTVTSKKATGGTVGTLGTMETLGEAESQPHSPEIPATSTATDALSPPTNLNPKATGSSTILPLSRVQSPHSIKSSHPPSSPSPSSSSTTSSHSKPTFLSRPKQTLHTLRLTLSSHFPTFFTALPRLPFALVPFAFSQFILIEGLTRQGWIEIFASWLSRASGRGQVYPTIWLVGILGVILCNISGTNIGATILLTKVIRAAPGFDHDSQLAGAIALAVASNIGAVSFTFSASLAGLLWRGILKQKGIFVRQGAFASWNAVPLCAMVVVGLSVVCAEMAVLVGRR